MHSETDASLAPSWNCRHWATGLGGRQAARSRPSDRRRRTLDGRACCADVVVRRDGGGWKMEVADDWHHPMWGGSSSWGTGEPCLGDTKNFWECYSPVHLGWCTANHPETCLSPMCHAEFGHSRSNGRNVLTDRATVKIWPLASQFKVTQNHRNQLLLMTSNLCLVKWPNLVPLPNNGNFG